MDLSLSFCKIHFFLKKDVCLCAFHLKRFLFLCVKCENKNENTKSQIEKWMSEWNECYAWMGLMDNKMNHLEKCWLFRRRCWKLLKIMGKKYCAANKVQEVVQCTCAERLLCSNTFACVPHIDCLWQAAAQSLRLSHKIWMLGIL